MFSGVSRREFQTYRAANYETVLHLCVAYNKPNYIKTLICDIGCEIQRQNAQGETALHMALALKNEEFTEAILNIFESIRDAKSKLLTQFVELVQCYSDWGYNVLHEAVVQNQPEILLRLLRLCDKFKVNPLDYEVLGRGKSLLHLSLALGNDSITDIIMLHLKQAVMATDYSGCYCYEQADIGMDSKILFLGCVARSNNEALLNKILRYFKKHDNANYFKIFLKSLPPLNRIRLSNIDEYLSCKFM